MPFAPGAVAFSASSPRLASMEQQPRTSFTSATPLPIRRRRSSNEDGHKDPDGTSTLYKEVQELRRELGVWAPCEDVGRTSVAAVKRSAGVPCVGFELVPPDRVHNAATPSTAAAAPSPRRMAGGGASYGNFSDPARETPASADRDRSAAIRPSRKSIGFHRRPRNSQMSAEARAQQRKLLEKVSRSCGLSLEPNSGARGGEAFRVLRQPSVQRTQEQQREMAVRLARGLSSRSLAGDVEPPKVMPAQARTGSSTTAWLAEQQRWLGGHCRGSNPSQRRQDAASKPWASLSGRRPLSASCRGERRRECEGRPVSAGCRGERRRDCEEWKRVFQQSGGIGRGGSSTSVEGGGEALHLKSRQLTAILHAAQAGTVPVHMLSDRHQSASMGDDVTPLDAGVRTEVLAAALAGKVPVRSITTCSEGPVHRLWSTTEVMLSTSVGASEASDVSGSGSVCSTPNSQEFAKLELSDTDSDTVDSPDRYMTMRSTSDSPLNCEPFVTRGISSIPCRGGTEESMLSDLPDGLQAM